MNINILITQPYENVLNNMGGHQFPFKKMIRSERSRLHVNPLVHNFYDILETVTKLDIMWSLRSSDGR